MQKIIAAIFSAVSIAGCSAPTRPTPEQLAAATYDAPPAKEAIEPAIKEWAQNNLKDPDSMKLRIAQEDPMQGYASACVNFDGTFCHNRMFYFGHLVRAQLNAKNTYGGYTGFTPYVFVFRGNKVFQGVKE